MTMRVRAVLMVMVALAMMGLAGCDHYNCNSGATFGSSSCTAGGGGSTNNGQTALVYFAGGADELALAGLNVAGSGTFEPVSSFVSPSLPTGVVGMATVNQLYLYVALANENVYGFSIDATTGALTPLTNSPYTVGALGTVNSVAVDPTGRFLFVAGIGGVSVFSVNSTNGELTLTNNGVAVPDAGRGSRANGDGWVGQVPVRGAKFSGHRDSRVLLRLHWNAHGGTGQPVREPGA